MESFDCALETEVAKTCVLPSRCFMASILTVHKTHLNSYSDSSVMNYWVAGHIAGGLGNRLFQHAAALGLAEKWGRKAVFALPHVEPTNHGPFESLFRLFPKTPVLVEEEESLYIPEPYGYVFTYLPFQSDPIAKNIVIDGWRQTERYFPAVGVHAALEDCVSALRQKSLFEKYGLTSSRETTYFMHIRLGDYLILPHHQIDVGQYLKEASKHFAPKSRFLIFSDEASKYGATLKASAEALGFEAQVVEEEDELEALFLMSQCWGGAIVGNSTFSWWGAYFARQRCPNKQQYKACFPRVWGAGLPPARDIVPSWGIPIDNL